ncbi:hypothetical protein B0H16DRAFT_1544202, partial [Mycena metata]
MSTMDIDNMKIARDVQLSRSLFLSGIVILLYDHLLTIGSEIQYIWVTTHKRSSIWFLLIRYFSFAGNIVMALDTFGDFGLEVCAKLRVTTGLIIVTQELIIGSRTSASGCYVPQSKAELAGDILVIGLTLYRSYTQRRNGVSFAGSLWRIMIRDVPIICLVNMANILMFYIYTSNSLSWFTSAISVAMISRLMLNLHVAATREIEMDTDMELET